MRNKNLGALTVLTLSLIACSAQPIKESTRAEVNTTLLTLIAQGADVRDEQGRTPLMIAAQQNDVDLIQTLIAKGAKVDDADSNGLTALMYATRNGYRSAVELLIANGAATDAASNNGVTPLMMAAARGQLAVLEYLLERQTDVNRVTKVGDTAYFETLRGHGPSAPRCGADRDRSMARSRIAGDNPNLLARRHENQGTCARTCQLQWPRAEPLPSS